MPNEALNQVIRQGWRELGFFYDRNDVTKEWIIVGSVSGLLKFAWLIREYASDKTNDFLSEHSHYGPYSYLELGTWDKAEITDHWIAAPLPDLLRLSSLVQAKVSTATVGDIFKFREEFAPSSAFELVVRVREDRFDPALADKYCW